MKIKQLIYKASHILRDSNIENHYNEALYLFKEAFSCDTAYIFANSENEADIIKEKLFLEYIEKRKDRMPVAYILKKAYFMSLAMHVDKGVLIPRPETEILAETALDISRKIKNASVLDICSGTGCIGISLAYYNKDIKCILSDVSPISHAICNKNIVANNLVDRVEFIRSNLFCSLQGRTFDIIVSNPPYIRSDEINYLMNDVKDYEPHLALDGGEDGLYFYKRITEEATKHLKNKGCIIFETGYEQAYEVREILLKNGYGDIEIIKDYSGMNRVVKAVLFHV